jgi:hypothetical protein
MANSAQVTDLYRYAVKGLDADRLEHVDVSVAGETFPDDRRFALMKSAKLNLWKGQDNKWIHKENFLCAFTAPELLAGYTSNYRIVSADPEISRGLPCDALVDSPTDQDPATTTQRLLDIQNRATGETLLGPVDLATDPGRQALAAFWTEQSGTAVTCVSSSSCSTTASQSIHNHQFGNTGSGVKASGDTRTLHIVNRATVRDLSAVIGVPLDAYRFRPNIVIDGPAAWSEVQWVGKRLRVTSPHGQASSTLILKVIQKTVRCEATRIDPNDPEHVLEIPKLLIQHFPQYGPYLGVYAVVEAAGSLAVGGELELID